MIKLLSVGWETFSAHAAVTVSFPHCPLPARKTDRLIIDAGEQYKAKGRLYRALGAIAGAVIAVIIV